MACTTAACATCPTLLQPGDLLVFNDTKVIPARLHRRRGTSGGKVEALLIREQAADRWLAFARPGKRLRIGDALTFGGARRPRSRPSTTTARSTSPSIAAAPSCWRRIETAGAVPLPPYIRGGIADARDRADYQTLFAKHRRLGRRAHRRPAFHARADGARSTPPASRTANVTLHVGAGTFQPVRVDDTDQHMMHAEWGEVPQATADAIAARPSASSRSARRRCACSRAWRARRARCGPWTGETDIFITPGFQFRAVDLLLTNFHLPRSTLFMLVSAFAGLERMKAAYAHAVRRAIPLLFLRRLLSVAPMRLVADESSFDCSAPTAPPAAAASRPRTARSRRRPSCRSAPRAR